MPSNNQHLAQAAHNEGLLAYLRQQAQHIEYGDWYVTVAFYTAVHYIEALLYSIKPVVKDSVAVSHSFDARKAFNLPTDHRAREQMLKRGFHNLYERYEDLYQLSQAAKYNCHIPSKFDWGWAVSLLELVKAECAVASERQKTSR